MKRIILFFYVVMAVCISAVADDKVTFTASAPDAVAVGDQFRLSFTINTLDGESFRAPTVTGFDVLMGPNRSVQTGMQMINGRTISSQSVTYTYILMAKKEGSYSIPGATIKVDGKQLTSNPVQVKVLPADSNTSANNGGASARSNGRISDSDIFITCTANKTNVYEQEAILLTYKIYTAVDLRGFDNVKLPDFKGFHSQEVELPNNRKWSLEHYKGRNYQSTVYRQFVLFPQQTGKLTIGAAHFDASIVQVTQVADPFEAFFNGGSGAVEIKKQLNTPRLTINVNSLPSNKPSDFSGGVGDFSISSSINSTSVKTNDAVTVKVVISGTGNLRLISTPEIEFPADFEVYDPKVDTQSRLTADGLSGSQIIEYLVIPRSAGDYKIPPVTFSYFDIKSRSYKTLSTEGYNLHVEKGAGDATQTIANFTNKEDLKVLNEDIRFIKQNEVKLLPRGKFFFGSLAYWLFYIIPVIVFIVFFVMYRKQIAANANVARMRTKKANKVAVKRMKVARRLLSENKRDAFYDEVLKALWGYISDKLNIPVSQLSRDNVEEELHKYGVDEGLTKGFIDALNNCEFARFAPGDANQAMDKVYTDSLEVIARIENSIKH